MDFVKSLLISALGAALAIVLVSVVTNAMEKKDTFDADKDNFDADTNNLEVQS